MVKIISQFNEHADSLPQEHQQPRRNYLLYATILLIVFAIVLFIMGPSVGLNLPCHGGSQAIYTNSTTQSTPLIPIN